MVMQLLIVFGLVLPSDTSQVFSEVVITANRSEQKAFETAASVYVLNGKTMENRVSRTSPEALLGIGGVFLQKTNHGGGSPFVRGLTGNQSLLIIDGIRLNNSTFRYGPNQYFNTINPFNIQRIEALNGSGSVQYGSDALGGAIQVISRSPDFNSGLQVNISGRAGLPKQELGTNVELNYGGRQWGLAVNGALRKFGDLLGGKNTGIQSPSGYNEHMFDAKILFKTGNGILTLANQFFKANDVPVYHKITLENYILNQFSPQERNLSYLKYEEKGSGWLIDSWQLNGSFHQTEEGRQNTRAGIPDQKSVENDQVKTGGLNTLIHSTKGNWRATSGIDIYRDLVKSSRKEVNLLTGEEQFKRGLYPDNSTAFSAAIYSLQSYHANQWKFTGGLRYTLNRINISDETNGSTKISPNALTPSISVSRFYKNDIHTYLSYSSGFRSPNVDDMGTLGVVDFRYEIPSYGLRPERSDAFEFGVKLQKEKFSFTGSIFHTKLSEIITREKLEGQQIDGYQVYAKKNTQSAFINGFELSYQIQTGEDSKVFGQTSYTYGQNLRKEEPLRRMPPLFGNISYQLTRKRFYFMPEFFFAASQRRLSSGDIDDNRINPDGSPGWAVLNINSGLQFNRFDLKGSLQNILNTDYRMHGSGINGAGRVLSIQLTYSL